MKKILFFVIFLSSFSLTAAPKYTDYCQMLGRDIEGKQYSFIAGNKMYYIGGKVDEYWRPVYHETIGLMHPIFRDGRARGYGIAQSTGGLGHDKFGWEFWNYTKGAIGTVIIEGKKYKNLRPISMVWRPDRVICSYEVAGVNIKEEKFITENDVLCDRITSDKSIQIFFEGHSFVNPDAFPTFDGDAPGQRFSQTQTATGSIKGNIIHVLEGGTTLIKPDWKELAVGPIMYDEVSMLISASEPLQNPKINRNSIGRQEYSFTLDIHPDKPTTLAYTMGDSYHSRKSALLTTLRNVDSFRDAKTEYMNDLLNHQIPYFRCSDNLVVQTYYYLWSLYFMYFTDIGEGYESYSHTQTAINNFMGLHLWDSWAYTAMGSWVVDKWNYGYGNVLSWKHMIPFKGKANSLPDNFGTTWYSPGVGMNLVGSVEFGWDMYRKSGDKKFLSVLYNDLFRPLYWDNNGPQPSMGEEINAIQFLKKMAQELGKSDDINHWSSMQPRLYKNWSGAWEGYADDFYAGKGAPWKDIWNLASLLNYDMPKDWARRMTQRWTMNSEDGFLGPVSFLIRPPDEPENGVFAVSSISTWLAIEGLFRHDMGGDGVLAALSHLNGMTKDYGFPVAPECWEPENFRPWGSLYYNWDGAMVDLILRRIIGVDFSLQENKFIFNEHLPESWDWMEASIPVVMKNFTIWVNVRSEQQKIEEGLKKTVTVNNSPFKETQINAWINERECMNSTDDSLAFTGKDGTLSLLLGERANPSQTYASVRPYQRIFIEPLTVKIENIEQGTLLRYTLDGSTPDLASDEAPRSLIIRESCELKLRAWNRYGEARETYSIPFNQATIAPSIEIDKERLKNGLVYEVFEGSFKRLSNLTNQVSVKKGISSDLKTIEVADRETDFGLKYRGFIKIPEKGLYTFYLTSDDGSRLKIGDTVVAELNVLSDLDPWMSEGNIALNKGFYPIEIDYFQYRKRSRLELKYKNNSGTQKKVSSDMFFHKVD